MPIAQSRITAQWTNPDGSKPTTYILYFKAKTQLAFSNTKDVEGAEAIVRHCHFYDVLCYSRCPRPQTLLLSV